MRAHGFTLLELLVAVAVATVLLTIGIPSFMQMIAANQRQTNAADVFSALNYARSESIARNVPIGICPGTDTSKCSSGTWHEGWIIFVRDANNKPILQSHGALSGDFTLTSATFSDGVVFLPTGRTNDQGQFTLCPDHADLEGRIIAISSTGRPRTAAHQCSTGN